MGTPCMWKENYEIMKQLRDAVITYFTFTETTGSGIGDFADAMINKAIALAIKLKENRDYIDKALSKPISTEQQEIEIANAILDGTYQEDMLASIMRRLYC